MAQKSDQRRTDAKKLLDERRQELDEQNAKSMERMDMAKPTPTQEENDLARLGVHVEEKEDDGSGPERPIVKTMYPNQPLGTHGYETRSVRAKHE